MGEQSSGRLSHGVVSGGLDYFVYQVRVAREVLLPWLRDRVDLKGAHVADFGTHGGGTVEGLRGCEIASATGFEINEEIVRSSRFSGDERFRIVVADLTALTQEGSFDLVLLHDVLEHVVDCDAVLAAARNALTTGGKVFVSFPPYRSAFGGHQFLAEGKARFAPYVHYLPESLFLRLVRPADNKYMARSDAIADVIAVRRTRLTLAKAERAFARAGLRIASSEFWALRPEYEVRYGMPTLRAGLLARVPFAREVLVNGAFYLLEVAD